MMLRYMGFVPWIQPLCLAKLSRLREKGIRWVDMTAATQSSLVLLYIVRTGRLVQGSVRLCSVIVTINIEHCLIQYYTLIQF